MVEKEAILSYMKDNLVSKLNSVVQDGQAGISKKSLSDDTKKVDYQGQQQLVRQGGQGLEERNRGIMLPKSVTMINQFNIQFCLITETD